MHMGRLGNSFFAKTALLFCVLMQAVAVMPHHHHGDDLPVCLAYSHVYEADSCGSVCTGAHVPDHHRPYAACAAHSITVVQPDQRDECVVAAQSSPHQPDCGCVACAGDTAARVTAVRITASFEGCVVHSDTEPYLRHYLVRALACRAPDFMG